MATGKYTLLDLAIRSGKNVQSLIEGVVTFAPELAVIPTFPRAGITYGTLSRTALPSGDFRKVGGGSPLNKSEWKKEIGSMALFEAQMQIAEDIAVAARAENPDLVLGDLLADEAIATLKGSAIRIGSQFWYGTKVSTDGFAGLVNQVDAANLVNGGGNAGADSSSVYLVRIADSPVNPQGVHFLLGNGGRMNFNPTWGMQQVPTGDTPAKYFTAFTNNFLAYLGLVQPRKENVLQVKNVNVTNVFDDAQGANVLSKVPIALRQDKSQWRWFMNTSAQYWLQKSRATVSVATGGDKGVGGTGVYPAEPTTCQGITIVVTDSLVGTERAGTMP